jgi:hypothetical protein
MDPCYTVEQLLALRPIRAKITPVLPESPGLSDQSKQYLNLFRKYLAFIKEGPQRAPLKEPTKTVLKYSYSISNKEFKRRWVKTHGTSEGLKHLPRFAVKQRSIRVFGLEYWFRQVGRQEKLLAKLLKRLVHTERGFTSTVKPSIVPPPCRVEKQSSSRPKKRDRLARKHYLNDGTEVVSFAGGRSVVIKPHEHPPVKRWTKYWYFYRKRGSWKPSEHHPYGDEVAVLTNSYG